MEENKRNVQDVVNKLRSPAIITERKILKPNRQFHPLPLPNFANRSECKPPANSLKTNSLFSIIDCNKDEKLLYKNYNFEEVRDSSTQTSKTIIQLAKLQTGDMSPDSLSPSPRKYKTECCQCSFYNSVNSNFDNFTLTDSASNASLSYTRKNELDHYLQNSEATGSPKSEIFADRYAIKEIYPKTSIIEETHQLPRNSLINTFMQKSKNRLNHDATVDPRAKFLQQTSPLKKMHEMRSKSYVEAHNHPNYVPEEDRTQPQYSRFTVKNVRANGEIDVYGRHCSPYQQKRSNSFMMPTLASEQKSKMKEVRSIKRLISPTRRGRSSSPRALQKVSNRVEIFRPDPNRIPYIDQSKSEISSSPYVVNVKERKSLVDRAGSPKKISPVVPPMNFQADMLRIDQLSLTLPSEEDLTNRTKATDVISVSSSENALGAVLVRIQNSDWNIALRGLAEATEMCRTLDINFMMPHMITINQKLIELLRSPRSHVCRTACQAAGHLFESMKDTRGPEFNDIVDILLCKTADANKFIRQDANLALDCMVTHVPTFHAIRAICSKGPPHKNHLVRCASVRLMICAVVIAGPDVILNPANNEATRKRIFLNMIKFLEDKNLETRKYGERLYKVLSKEPSFDAYLKKYMDKDDLNRMKKTLKFLVGKKY